MHQSYTSFVTHSFHKYLIVVRVTLACRLLYGIAIDRKGSNMKVTRKALKRAIDEGSEDQYLIECGFRSMADVPEYVIDMMQDLDNGEDE